MEQAYVPEESKNCRVRKIIIDNLEKRVDDMVGEVEHIKQDNGIQNELLAKFDTMIEFIVRDREEEKDIKKEQREINKKTVETLQSMNDNLIILNSDMDNVKIKVNSLENAQKIQSNRGKIDIIQIFTSEIGKFIAVIIGSGLMVGGIYLVSNM